MGAAVLRKLRINDHQWTRCSPPGCFSPVFQDYKGQKLAEQIFQGIILVSAVRVPDLPTQLHPSSQVDFPTLCFQVIGFIYGLIIQQFGWTVYIVLAGFAVSCVVSLSSIYLTSH